MDEGDENDDLERWVRVMNKGHGYAGVFNSDTSDDKRIVEMSTIEEWRVSIEAELAIQVDAPQANPNDPPDFFVSIRGQRLTVELVQLVDEKHKRRAANNETPFAGQLFSDMQWSRDRLISKLDEVISNKGNKYARVGIKIDVLLIHTAEPWLSSTEAMAWLEDANIKAHSSIRAVSLLFEYEPGRGVAHWPVIPIYGELPPRSSGG